MNFKKPWQKIVLALGGLLVFEAGARVVAPGLNGEALGAYLRNGGGTLLLSLYDRIGGGLSRGGVLALGIMPYLTARIMLRLMRVVSPEMETLSETSDGRIRLRRWTRVLTVGLALIQSYGFARFVQAVPGAVAHPGISFIAQTMLLLTAGSVVAMTITEAISGSRDDERPARPTADPLLGPGATPLTLGIGEEPAVLVTPRAKAQSSG